MVSGDPMGDPSTQTLNEVWKVEEGTQNGVGDPVGAPLAS